MTMGQPDAMAHRSRYTLQFKLQAVRPVKGVQDDG
jgi:hypothetical protein